MIDITQELFPCVACAAITSIGEVVEKSVVRIRTVYAARLFVNGEPVGTPLWESDRKLAEALASNYRQYNPALSDAPATNICVKILRRMVVTIDL